MSLVQLYASDVFVCCFPCCFLLCVCCFFHIFTSGGIQRPGFETGGSSTAWEAAEEAMELHTASHLAACAQVGNACNAACINAFRSACD